MRIVSDGTPMGTHVYSAGGEKLRGICAIDIGPIRANGLVTASLLVELVGLDLDLPDDQVRLDESPAEAPAPLYNRAAAFILERGGVSFGALAREFDLDDTALRNLVDQLAEDWLIDRVWAGRGRAQPRRSTVNRGEPGWVKGMCDAADEAETSRSAPDVITLTLDVDTSPAMAALAQLREATEKVSESMAGLYFTLGDTKNAPDFDEILSSIGGKHG